MLKKAEDLHHLQYSLVRVRVARLKGECDRLKHTSDSQTFYTWDHFTKQEIFYYALLPLWKKILWGQYPGKRGAVPVMFFFSPFVFPSWLSSFLFHCSHTSHIKMIVNKHMPWKATLLSNVVTFSSLPFGVYMALILLPSEITLSFYVLRCSYFLSPSCHIIPLQRLYQWASFRSSLIGISEHNKNTKTTHGCV